MARAASGAGSSGAEAALPSMVDRVLKVRQERAWDCGIASSSMILRSLPALLHLSGADAEGDGGSSAVAAATERHGSLTLEALTRELGLESVWTIDVAFLLAAHGAATTFHTTTLGANESFSDMDFYKKELVADGERVNAMFERAAEAGVAVVEHRLSLDDIRARLLARRSVFIVLTDLRCLTCTRCMFKNLTRYLQFSFAGHYVVVCDYDADRDEYAYKDPASSAETCWIRTEDLEAARSSFGTDDDIVEVHLDRTGGPLRRARASTEDAAATAAAAATTSAADVAAASTGPTGPEARPARASS